MFRRKYWKIYNLFSSNRIGITKTEKKKEITKTSSSRLHFIDSVRFMERSLSNLVNNLAEEIHKIQCKCSHDDKECENCRIKYKGCECFLESRNFMIS